MILPTTIEPRQRTAIRRYEVPPRAGVRVGPRRRRRCNLLLVCKRRLHEHHDFQQIARYIREMAPDVRPLLISDHFRNAFRPDVWLRQEFIYTGRWPVSYRVSTFFGKVLASWRVEADRNRRPLEGPEAFAGGSSDGGISIASSGKGCTFTLNADPEILGLAEQAHAAFPEIPLLAVDIVREQPSGKLYVLEVNSRGRTWHFSSPRGTSIQHDSGFDLKSQFDALRKAAAILIEQVRLHAR